MATKTISVDLEAYHTLLAARVSEQETFSHVIKRAKWQGETKTCGDLLKALPHMPRASEEALDRLEAAQRADEPPERVAS